MPKRAMTPRFSQGCRLTRFASPPPRSSRSGEPSPVRAGILQKDGIRSRSSKNPRAYATGLASKKNSVTTPGFLPISLPDLLSLLDRTARQLHGNKRGRNLQGVKPIQQRLGLESVLNDSESSCRP